MLFWIQGLVRRQPPAQFYFRDYGQDCVAREPMNSDCANALKQ